jgi:hypothetical protein
MDSNVTPLVAPDTPRQEANPNLSGQPIGKLRLIVEAQNSDTRSSQFQCVVRIENQGTQPLRVVSLRPLTPLGTEVQQVIDTAQSVSRLNRDDLYRELSLLLTGHLIKESAEYRKQILEVLRVTIKEVVSAKGIFNIYYTIFIGQTKQYARRITENLRAWGLEIRSASQAQNYYDQFLKSKEDSAKEVCLLYKAKLEDVRQLESELGDGIQGGCIADVEPGGVFARTYI